MSITYSVPVAARAAGIPVRRLESWLERGVVVATEPARGKGTRTRFGREDVLRIAILADIQRLFGSRGLRPGDVAARIGSDRIILAGLDTVMRRATQESTSRRDSDNRADRLRLYLYVDKGRARIQPKRQPPDEFSKGRGVLLMIDPFEIWQEIEPRLTA